MSKREWKLYVKDMNDSVKKIIKYTKGMNESTFKSDLKTFDAVIRNFEVLGEAANKIPSDFKGDNPEIPWRDIIDFRNRVIHEYFGISSSIVWNIIIHELPELKRNLGKLLK